MNQTSANSSFIHPSSTHPFIYSSSIIHPSINPFIIPSSIHPSFIHPFIIHPFIHSSIHHSFTDHYQVGEKIVQGTGETLSLCVLSVCVGQVKNCSSASQTSLKDVVSSDYFSSLCGTLGLISSSTKDSWDGQVQVGRNSNRYFSKWSIITKKKTNLKRQQ